MSEHPIALITGGAQGIGYASAEAIAESGARVVLVDINADGVKEAAEKLDGDAVARICGTRSKFPLCSTRWRPRPARSRSW